MAWDDFSDFVTHFTKPTIGQSEYDNQLSICADCCLKAVNPFGIARNIAPRPATQSVVCFSEVPLHCLSRIASRRSRYGIGFRKEFARTLGAMPIWYVEKDSPQNAAIDQLIQTALSSHDPSNQPIWSITPFIDVPGNYPSGKYRFEWEREWRHIGDFTFRPCDVAFLVIPEDLHVLACEFFRDARDEGIGPFFGCPYIDSSWDVTTVSKALTENWPHNDV